MFRINRRRRTHASRSEPAISTCAFGRGAGVGAELRHELDRSRQKLGVGLDHGMSHAVHSEDSRRVLVEVPPDDVPERGSNQQPVRLHAAATGAPLAVDIVEEQYAARGECLLECRQERRIHGAHSERCLCARRLADQDAPHEVSELTNAIGGQRALDLGERPFRTRREGNPGSGAHYRDRQHERDDLFRCKLRGEKNRARIELYAAAGTALARDVETAGTQRSQIPQHRSAGHPELSRELGNGRRTPSPEKADEQIPASGRVHTPILRNPVTGSGTVSE